MDEIDECVGYEKDHKWYGKWMQSGWKWCKNKELIVDENNGENNGMISQSKLGSKSKVAKNWCNGWKKNGWGVNEKGGKERNGKLVEDKRFEKWKKWY